MNKFCNMLILNKVLEIGRLEMKTVKQCLEDINLFLYFEMWHIVSKKVKLTLPYIGQVEVFHCAISGSLAVISYTSGFKTTFAELKRAMCPIRFIFKALLHVNEMLQRIY